MITATGTILKVHKAYVIKDCPPVQEFIFENDELLATLRVEGEGVKKLLPFHAGDKVACSFTFFGLKTAFPNNSGDYRVINTFLCKEVVKAEEKPEA